METKMKGLLKGLRYISQIFDSTKEPEMQIGYPTDVKHVAHIGWDNNSNSDSNSNSQASNNGPSWMTEFKGEPSPTSGGQANWSSPGLSTDFQGRELSEPTRLPRRTSSGDAASPKHDMSLSSHQTQRRHSSSSSGGGYAESPTRESIESRQSRKSRSAVATSGDSQLADAPTVPKQNRRRKTKGSSGSGSLKSKSKGMVSAPELEADDEPAMTGIGMARTQLSGTGEDSY